MEIIIHCTPKIQCVKEISYPHLNSIYSSQCPKFNKCNAPVCPLDAKSLKVKHISGEKCCMYLLETAKTNAKANFIGAGLSDLYEVITTLKDEILSSSATIRRAFIRASITPTRLHPTFLKVNKS